MWTVPGYAYASFLQKFSWAFIRMDPLNVLAKFEICSFSVPEIIGRHRKNWAVPGYAHAPFSLKFLMGFCSDAPPECTGQIEIHSFSRS